MPSTFMEIVNRAEEARRADQPAPPLHVAVAGAGTAAAEYARELIRRGLLASTPVEIDCGGARFRGQTLALVGQALGGAAQGGLLILNNAQELGADEELLDRVLLACESRECTVVLAGARDDIAGLLKSRFSLRQAFPLVDADDDSILRAREEAARQAVEDLKQAVEEAVTLSHDIRPLKTIRLSPESKP